MNTKEEFNQEISYQSNVSTNYKCPNCGAPIAFNVELQLFKCDFCWSQYSPQEMEQKDLERRKSIEQRLKNARSKEVKAKANDQVVLGYHCENCGADVVTDNNTTATICYYCHSPIILESRMLGNDRPDEIIPFNISREEAERRFIEWTKTKRYIPRDFTSNSQLEKLTGVYVPYWFLDSDVKVAFVGTSKKRMVWRVGDYLHTEVTSYEHIRNGTQYFTDVNILGTNKIDVNLLNGIEPYDTDYIKEFSMPLLSGFFAESYTLNESDANNVLRDNIYTLADTLLQKSFNFTDNVSPKHKNFHQSSHGARYVMLPLWILTYQYNDKIYIFAVNGQTGSTFGELPIVKSKLIRDSILLGLLSFVIILLIVMFFF